MSLLQNVTLPRKPFTRRDILRNKRIQFKRSAIVERAQAQPPNRRFAVTKRLKKGFHVVGLGHVEALNYKALLPILKANGFTHIIMGAIHQAL